jgi:uncharacterized membrane-anchored protein YhcB (DUF1043 family)
MIHGGDMQNLLIGTIIGIFLCAVVVNFTDDTKRQVHEMVKECEKYLPRNEKCYIIAVPPSKD